LRPLPILLAVGVAAVCLLGCIAWPGGGEPEPATAGGFQCELCHGTVRTALLATQHGKVGHTCQTCHGPSVEHTWIEDGSIAPTRPLKTRAKVDALCNSCHKDYEHRLPVPHTRRCSACHDPHPKKEEDEQADAT